MPAAGVIATNPTTAPRQAPVAEGTFFVIMSSVIHVEKAAAAAMDVFIAAMAAIQFAAPTPPSQHACASGANDTCTSAVEPKPSKPKESSPKQYERHIARQLSFSRVVSVPLANDGCCNQRTEAARDVNHRPPCKTISRHSEQAEHVPAKSKAPNSFSQPDLREQVSSELCTTHELHIQWASVS